MISKNIKNLEKIIEKINRWQSHEEVHPLTCGIDSSHELLEPRLSLVNDVTGDHELILVCKNCEWRQDIPEFINEINI